MPFLNESLTPGTVTQVGQHTVALSVVDSTTLDLALSDSNQLSGTVRGLGFGGTALATGAVPTDGQYLRRVGSQIVGGDPAGGGINVSATDKILGRKSSGAGQVEEIDCTAAGRALLDDVDSISQRTTLGFPAGISEVWIDVSGGSDTTGLINRRDLPFKTFESAYAAMSNDTWGLYYVVPQKYGDSGKLNSTNAITINRSVVIVNNSFYNNKGPGFEDCTITIHITDRKPVYFRGIYFFNATLDAANVVVTSVSDHQVQFDDCFFVNYVNGGGRN